MRELSRGMSPIRIRSTFGRSGRSRVPAPSPIASIGKAGTGPKLETSSARNAAPVGVVISIGIGQLAKGMPRSNSAVAGAGSDTTPWAMRICPYPVGIGLLTACRNPKLSQAIALPRMSTRESIAPTS